MASFASYGGESFGAATSFGNAGDKNFKVPVASSLNTSNTWDAVESWVDNVYVQALNEDLKWGNGDPDFEQDTLITYFIYDDVVFLDKSNDIPESYEGTELTAQPVRSLERDSMISAMQGFENVSGLKFEEVFSPVDANIAWAILDAQDTGDEDTYGWSYHPWSDIEAALATVNKDAYNLDLNPNDLQSGSIYYLTYIHELGHTLGFGHPHPDFNGDTGVFPGVAGEYEAGDNELNSTPWTVMTYVDTWASNGYSPQEEVDYGYLETPGPYDIAIAQHLYGPNEDYNSGDTTYLLDGSLNGYQAIWDAGGADSIDATAAPSGVEIDLRNATLENEQGGGGFVSGISEYYSGYIIPFYSTGSAFIENAFGSDFDDTIRGNEFVNQLLGGKGDDSIDGGEGGDYIDGGEDDDYILGGEGGDTLVGGDGNDTYVGGAGNDLFFLDNGANLVVDFDATQDFVYIESDNYSPSVVIADNSLSLLDENSGSSLAFSLLGQRILLIMIQIHTHGSRLVVLSL